MKLGDVVGEVGLDPISQRFNNKLIYDITQTYRSKVLGNGRIRFFWNESNIGLVELCRQNSMSVEICYQLMNVMFRPTPRCFVEGCITSIMSWGCIAPHFSDDGMNPFKIGS